MTVKGGAQRLAWLSPFGPRSDVGAHSAAIVGALDRLAPEFGFDLSLFVERNGPVYRTSAQRVLDRSALSKDVLALFDVVALNIGNHVRNHRLINELAISRGGVIIVHDVNMHGFVASQLLLRSAKVNRYVDILCRHYGAAAIEALDLSGATLDGRQRRYDLWGTEQGQAFPLLEPFLEKAEAIVVHSRFAAEIVATLSDAPQLELFLPSDKKAPPAKAEPSGDGRVRFCFLGHIHRSKQVLAGMEAFASSSLLRTKASLRIAGGAVDGDYVNQLVEFARARQLLDVVKFEFNVSEKRLKEIKSLTDVFINLRFPNAEGASGSLAEQMACGVATIVLDSGCFREIPDEAVVKIPDIRTAELLRAAMERLVDDPTLRAEIGGAAREFGRERTAAAYARRFLEFLSSRAGNGRAMRRALASPPFPWLDRDLDGGRGPADSADPLDPEGPPFFRAIERLNSVAVAKYIALALFRTRPAERTLDEVALTIRRLEPQRRVRLVGRLAYFLRCVGAEQPLSSGSNDLGSDDESLMILRRFDSDRFTRLLFLALLGRPATVAEREDAMRLDPPPGEQMSTLLQTDEALASQIAPFRLDRLKELATRTRRRIRLAAAKVAHTGNRQCMGGRVAPTGFGRGLDRNFSRGILFVGRLGATGLRPAGGGAARRRGGQGRTAGAIFSGHWTAHRCVERQRGRLRGNSGRYRRAIPYRYSARRSDRRRDCHDPRHALRRPRCLAIRSVADRLTRLFP